ncbi:hypothetical protein Aple_064730 [Acrocarpospora pleiomorpha]|uniref:Uncharacterized protein n=1 Tax=Acrocarpospora pleiomorpha TaxID=90975 RepID=A0A5M3XQP4_9ACTN|nr:hypothetical protein [Acrocarpospora pleiomorpha]GES23574.1 hypothetical protein Aple_064730 [Acrocarpospora pleiomorpha]
MANDLGSSTNASVNSTAGTTGSINVSVIAPAAYLRDFVAQAPATVHHVAAQRVLHDLAYREFFLQEATLGATIILDNGVFDLGTSLGPDDLVRAARAVHAEEIILPDVMGDGPATMRASDAAAARILDLSDEFRLCAVVHAADDTQWHRCYDHLVSSDYVGAIAFPASRRKQPSQELSKNRLAMTRHLDDHGLVDPGRIYRLLGLGQRGHLELFEQRGHTWISSVDCAAPVLMGAMGVAMLPDGPYEKIATPRVETVEWIDPARFALIRDNIKAVRYAAGCPIKIRMPR